MGISTIIPMIMLTLTSMITIINIITRTITITTVTAQRMHTRPA